MYCIFNLAYWRNNGNRPFKIFFIAAHEQGNRQSISLSAPCLPLCQPEMYQLVPSLPVSIISFCISFIRAKDMVGFFSFLASKAFFPIKSFSRWYRKSAVLIYYPCISCFPGSYAFYYIFYSALWHPQQTIRTPENLLVATGCNSSTEPCHTGTPFSW